MILQRDGEKKFDVNRIKIIHINKRINWRLLYTECPRRNVKYFGRVFLMLNYTDITQNTYIQS